MKLNWQIVRLELKEIFSISYGKYAFREALIISLSKNGKIGFGECTAIDYYHIDLKDFIAKLNQIKIHVEREAIQHPFEFYSFLKTFEISSFLLSALDCAYWDLFGKLENKSFLALNNINYFNLNDSSLTISIAPTENQITKINTSDWRKFKVKCNRFDLKSIEKLLSTQKEIALDANGSFSVEDCKFLEEHIIGERLSYVEQPLKVGQENYSYLDSSKLVNWMADEDSQGIGNIETLKPHYKVLNVKLVKVGGLTPALEFIKKAKENHFKIMIGCMTETTVGISAGAVLAPLVDFVDLDGANLIINDIAIGTSIANGKIELSNRPGLGISLK
ncbi:chloromuconate cycloisomerase [Flavobacterium jejuense]|uniref:Chloromuconate cycloisomerase n=1 Tax=Flavobacterium jejuense TaxID=1544455 RepID=A0ABX0ISH0_9FLAO|nr:enolase C-terminal domain-like protein [Flavobacterium jejuense]NHN26732.1 chloromuconate cycloisomerase [Flavobacterium jejuense]